MGHKVPFAMETVFSYWQEAADGTVLSKLDLIRELQHQGYFVLLIFVGLTSSNLSIGRVQTRRAKGGHDVAVGKLRERFPRTQMAIRNALPVVDAAVLMDNSRGVRSAFSLCVVQTGSKVLFDIRDASAKVPGAISAWLESVSPRISPSSP